VAESARFEEQKTRKRSSINQVFVDIMIIIALLFFPDLFSYLQGLRLSQWFVTLSKLRPVVERVFKQTELEFGMASRQIARFTFRGYFSAVIRRGFFLRFSRSAKYQIFQTALKKGFFAKQNLHRYFVSKITMMYLSRLIIKNSS
jgi:hypothetical protein